MVKYRKLVSILLIFMFSISLTGCDRWDALQVKMGWKNQDFEYIKQGKIEKIVIQNTRDKGFRFVVTDQKAIKDLYDILSTAKEVKEKSTLSPDYIFEMQEGPNQVHKFSYIAGSDKKDAGNLYSDDKVYLVSKRIDNDIIKNFDSVKKPKNFETIYYNSILKVVDDYLKSSNKQGKTVGINLKDDVESAKFIMSTDLELFKDKLQDKGRNASITEKDKSYDLAFTVKTVGYKLTVFKATVTIWDKNEKSEVKYYINDQYLNGSWNTDIFTDKDKEKVRDF